MAAPVPQGTARLLAAAAAATTCAVLPGFLIGSQSVQLGRDLGIGLGAVGAAVSVAWLTGSALSAPMGRVAERMGGGRSLRVAAVAGAVAMALIALVARSWPLLALGAGAGGAANALAQPSANLLIARRLPPERHGLGFGVKQAAIPFATVLGGLAVPAVTLTLGWRWTFGIGAGLALGAAAAVPVGPTAAGPSAHGRAADGSPPLAGTSAAGTDRGRRPSGRARLGRERRRALVVLGAGVGCGAAAAGALSSFLVPGAVDAGVAEGWAGILLTVGSLLGISVRLTLGVRADRVGGDQLPLVAGMMLVGAAALATFAAAATPVYVLATPLAFGAGWAWPGLFNLSVVRRFAAAPAAATGMTQTGTYLGAGLGPLGFGALAGGVGFGWAWLAAAAVLAAGSVTMAAGRRIVDRGPTDDRSGVEAGGPSAPDA